jgi:ribulose-phosphate 3-epimerase
MILASILSVDQANLAQECHKLIQNGIDGIHVDVMDDHFVPNLSYSPSVVCALRKHFPKLFIDCHLMVQNPKKVNSSCFLMLF